MKKSMLFLFSSLIAIAPCVQIVSCNNHESLTYRLNKILNYDKPKTQERWIATYNDVQKNIGELIKFIRDKWYYKLKDIYKNYADKNDTDGIKKEFENTVDFYNDWFQTSDELQLIMAYHVSSYYCQYWYNQIYSDNAIKQMDDTEINMLNAMHNDGEKPYAAVMYTSVTIQIGNISWGSNYDINYNRETPKAVLREVFNKRIDDLYALVNAKNEKVDK